VATDAFMTISSDGFSEWNDPSRPLGGPMKYR
jgi:hypothetical protein